MTEVDDFLEHYGVPGMKWGRRKSRSISKPNSSADAKKRDAILNKQRTKGVHSLTNKQLQDFNNRMNLEQNYKRLSPPTSVQKGQAHVKSILGTIGVGTSLASAIAFSNSPTGKALTSVFKQKFKKATAIDYNFRMG